MLCWNRGYECCVSWKCPLSWTTCHFRPVLKRFLFYVNGKFTFNVCDCERKITWRSPLSQTSHTWIELGLKFNRKNGRKIDGITQLTLFKFVYARKLCFLSSQLTSHFYLNIRFSFVYIYSYFYDSEAISCIFQKLVYIYST